jgi:DcuC family C4-dicarboxylate transporter
MTLLFGLLIIALAVVLALRRMDVRLILLLAALALGALANQLHVVVQKFLSTLTNEQFVIPIGCSLGFAYMLRQTGCDRHLVHLLVRPIRHVRPLLVPGTIVIAACLNVPVVSQTSTAVLVGTVLVPLMRAADISPVTTGAALLLGSSIGGELLNPGAPEVRTVREASAGSLSASSWVAHVAPLFLVELGVATTVFWVLSLRAERLHAKEVEARASGETAVDPSGVESFRINLLKAAVPFVPLTLLFLTALPEPFRLIKVPMHWLVDVNSPAGAATLQSSYDCRLIGAAMLIGVLAAALTDPRHLDRMAITFFEGIGYAFTHIISLIVAASCFGKGVELIGLAGLLGHTLEVWPALLLPAAAALPLAFALLCGSGMATTQSLFGFYVGPINSLGYDLLQVGAVVSLTAAAGRTMSPVAAVTLMCGSMVEVNPLLLARRVALPLIAGVVAVLVVSMIMAR